MDRITVREAYGHYLPLGIDVQIPVEILDMDEYDIPTWAEIDKMRAHINDLLAKPVPHLPGENSAAWWARSAAITAEAQSVMCAADRYSKLRRAMSQIRSAARWGVAPLCSNHV